MRGHRLLVTPLVVLALALVASACSTDEGTSLPSLDGVAPDAATVWTVPEGQVQDAVDELDSIVERALDQTGVPGLAVAVVHDDAVVYAKGFGVRDTRTGEPVDADTVFQLADLSVPLGATVTAKAVTDGGVDWEDKVIQYLPELALADATVTEQVTVEDLYAQRSGLPEGAGLIFEDLGFSQGEILGSLRYEPLEPFRTEFHYSDYGITLAGAAVAAAKTNSWAKLSEGLLYGPLGMERTSSTFDQFIAEPNRAANHTKQADGWVAADPTSFDARGAAGSANSSANDMAIWMRLVLANGSLGREPIVAPGQTQNLRVPRLTWGVPTAPASRATSYGLGTSVFVDETARVRLSHSGDLARGAAATVVMVPAENLGIVVLTNGESTGVAEAVANEFIERAETGEVRRDWLAGFGQYAAGAVEFENELADTAPETSLVTAPLEAYTGSYTSEVYGPAEVFLGPDGELVLRFGPAEVEWPLTVWEGHVFAMETRGEAAMGRQPLAFTMGADGRASAFTSVFFEIGLAPVSFTRAR